MDNVFSRPRLRKQCTEKTEMIRAFGTLRAKILRRRLDQLKAADHLGIMRRLPGRCHELTGDRKGLLSLDLDGPYRLLFEAAHDPKPQKPDGSLYWDGVTAVRISGVEDTHG